jgi:capsule polysaccharide export protein KpsE/RkpR
VKKTVPKKAKKQDDEQVELLREILAELRRLNANLEKMQQQANAAPEIEDAIDVEDEDDDDEDSEELEYFE